MTLTIDTSGYISIDGQDTGLGVSQGSHGTELYRRETIQPRRAYERLPLPHQRYVLSHPKGNDRNPGRDQFEADVRAVLGL
jgi:hypothetical protein